MPLPTGTVTFLFTDIEGSTQLLERLGNEYADILAAHHRLLHAAIDQWWGQLVDTQGDSFFVAFPRAKDALSAAIAAQRAIMGYSWPEAVSVRVRMGLHTGEPLSAEIGYVGTDVHRAARICAAAQGGQILVSLAMRELVEDDLPEGVSLRDLGEYRLKDLARPQRLFQVVAADLPSDFPPLRSLDAGSHNLPVQLTSFVGREREIAEVKRLLSETHLLTLIGAGGAGKTRLAVQVAAEVLEDFPHGVWLVELSALTDPSLVAKVVATTLRIPEQPGRSLTETVVDSVRSKKLLLVLDNCEHLLEACATVADAVLRTSPSLKVLATSQERLRIPGEATYRVPSLSLPDLRDLPAADQFFQYEAVRLFAERAGVDRAALTATRGNAQAVAQIVRRLDGIPLAIELAAARLNVLSPDQILARLNDRFRLLTSGDRTALPRHQTLRAVMDWSYGLLTEPEQAVLRRLSVFAGGFSLEAAEAVCGADSIDVADVLDLVAHLADKSLIVVSQEDGGVRYRLLETVRQYAHDRLVRSEDAEVVKARHRRFFLEMAEQIEPQLFSADEVALLERLETEHDNLRAVLARSLESNDLDVGLRLAGALGWFWYRRGHWTEGRTWLMRYLEADRDAAGPALKARALLAAARLAWAQGDFSEARRLGQQDLALREDLGDERGIAHALYLLGLVSYSAGNHEHGAAELEKSLRIFREIGDRYFMATVLRHMANVVGLRGSPSEAAQLAGESVALYRAVGYQRGVAYALLVLGLVAYADRDYARASARFSESLGIFQEAKDREGITMAQFHLGHVARATEDRETAVRLFRESLRAQQEMRSRRLLIHPLEGLAMVAASKGGAWRAARLFAATQSLREAGVIGDVLWQFFDRAEGVAAARRALGEAEFVAASTEGQAMTLEQAVEYALNEED